MSTNKIQQNMKSSFIELKNDVNGFIKFIKANKFTIITTWFFILMAYGIKLFWYSISIDTEAIINDYDSLLSSWVSIGRFGLILIKGMLRLKPFNPYIACFLMLCTMFLFCMIWSYIFNYLSFNSSNRLVGLCVFPIIFLTSPLFAEQFNFILQGFEVAFAIALCGISVFLITKWVISSSNYIHLILGLVCMVLGLAAYQSIASLYISGVLACYIIIYISNKKGNVVLSQNFFRVSVIKYLGTFVFGYLTYSILNKVFQMVYGSTGYLDQSITWGRIPVLESVENILDYIKETTIRGNFFYSKWFIVVVLFFIAYAISNLFSANKNKILFLLAITALLVSPFLLSIYLGQKLVIRSQFSFQFVIAFGLYLIVSSINKEWLQKIGLLAVLFIALGQSCVVSRLLYTDYMKYQSEVTLANKISSRIESLNLDKTYPVAFIGKYHPNNTPTQLCGEVIGKSFFEWDASTKIGSNYRISGFMKTIGYDINMPSQEQIDAARETAKSMPSWPNTNSIKFDNGVIVVKLSN